MYQLFVSKENFSGLCVYLDIVLLSIGFVVIRAIQHIISKINLTDSPYENVHVEKRVPCPYQIAWIWCCVYNRVAVTIPNEAVWQELQTCGYPTVTNAKEMLREEMNTATGDSTAVGVEEAGTNDATVHTADGQSGTAR